MNKKLIVVAITALTVAGAILATSTQVSAQNSVSSLVQKIADKFGLKKEDVQAVFDQAKTDRMAQRQTMFEDELTQLVKDGKISENQKQLIINKRKELMTNRKTKRSELQDWAKQNNIDLKYLMGLWKGPMGKRGGWFK